MKIVLWQVQKIKTTQQRKEKKMNLKNKYNAEINKQPTLENGPTSN